MMQECVNTPLVTAMKRQKCILDLRTQFAASAEKHEGAPQVNIGN